MSRSSGFASSVAVTTRGSSAMPQIGQLPGPSRMISGCIGQVQLIAAGAGAGIGPAGCATGAAEPERNLVGSAANRSRQDVAQK